jgi:phosphohistidine phosphatase
VNIAMRRLLLLRHAKAERPEPGQEDYDRVLQERGRSDAALVGTYLVRHEFVPDAVLVSPAARTRETWEVAAAAFPRSPAVTFDERIYNASAQTLLQVVKEAGRRVSTLLVIGHNPGLHELGTLLVGVGDLEARQRFNEQFPTAALAVIDFALDAWSKLHPAAGRLERFVRPRKLAAATD